MDDLNPVIAAQSGDRKAFGSLIDKYYKSIYRMAYQYSACHSEADEICQDTFLKALTNLKKLKRPSSFKQWLFSISTNLLRAKHKRRQLFDKYINSTDRAKNPSPEQPCETIIRHERNNVIKDCLQEMSEQMRLITIMVLMEGIHQKEVALILRMSEASVSRQLSTAKDLLRAELIRTEQ